MPEESLHGEDISLSTVWVFDNPENEIFVTQYKMVPTMLVEQKLLTRDRIKLHRKTYIGLHLAKS